jgi:hypothetical protein
VRSRVNLLRCQSFAASGLSDCPCRGTGPSVCGSDCPTRHRGLSAWHQLPADRPRTRYGLSIFSWCVSGGSVAFYRLSAEGRGPSAPGSRTVRLALRRVAKSFASGVVLPLQDCLGFVPRVGR